MLKMCNKNKMENLMFLVLSLCFLSISAQDSMLVNTTQGQVQGQRATDGDYVAFYGIHYAGNVDGANRFKAPPPPPSYPGIFIASDSTVQCAQPTSQGLIGVENCLVLNIFTKAVTGSKPVMVWLIGEQYSTGINQGLKFNNLVSEDIIVVTVNYRLSIFGFLCLRVEDAPGNAGLKDVIAALRWIKRNIAGFGGDPNNIVLAGHGSGGAMVDLITLSPLSDGLIQKAIAQSGSSLSPWAVAYNPKEYAEEVGKKLSYGGKTGQELAKAFQETALSVLIPVLNEIAFTNNTALFAPCLENKDLKLNDTFMIEAPLDIIRSGKYSHIPFITGYTTREGSVRAHQAVHSNWLNQMNANFSAFIQADLSFQKSNNASSIVDSIKKFYFSERQVSLDTIEDYLDYEGDTLVLVSAIRTATERARTSKAEVRLYEFGFIGSWSAEWPYPSVPLTGARHGQELVYLFNQGNAPAETTPSVDQSVRESIVRRWATFAKTGLPTAQTGPGAVEWQPIISGGLRALEYLQVAQGGIQEGTKINPHNQRMIFWNDIYSNYYVAPQPGSADKVFGCAMLFSICLVAMKLL